MDLHIPADIDAIVARQVIEASIAEAEAKGQASVMDKPCQVLRYNVPKEGRFCGGLG